VPAVRGIDASSTMPGADPARSQGQAGILGKDDFLKLLIAQLRNQDPLRPMEDKEFIAQMAQFNVLEQMQQLNQAFEAYAAMAQFGQASSLIGKTVVALPRDGDPSQPITGKVQSVSFIGKEVIVKVDNQLVSLADIIQVKEGN
jgi:flagellar basal-body rod modification protein FlgD